MTGLLIALIFVSIAAVTAFIGRHLWNWRARAIDRLAPPTETITPFLPSPSLAWRELVKRIGTHVPASSKDLPLVRRRLVRAGFRYPEAVRFFHGTRAVVTVLLALAGLGMGLHSGAATESLLFWMAGAGVAGYRVPMVWLLWRIRRRKHAIAHGLPNALDLMVVCVESGLGLDQTLIQVAKELMVPHPAICEEFAVVNLEMRAGKRRADALHDLAERTGVDDLKKLVAVLVQTDRFGTSIAQSLRGHADYMRNMARQKAEGAPG